MEYRTFDGSENNLTHPNWGQVGEQLLRLSTPSYSDGRAALAGDGRCNPRVVSNTICRQSVPRANARGLSDFVWAWGQFLDHELDLTGGVAPPEMADIRAPYNDPSLPNGLIRFNRSIYDRVTGNAANNPRQQINQISAYIDATNVYGFSQERAIALRGYGDGKLKTTPHEQFGDLLPFNEDHLENAAPNGVNPEDFFVAGDIRVNEHAVLIAMHTLFVREHNYQAQALTKQHPHRDDEQIYQQARKIVGALMQVITFKEFLPALLGDGVISPYSGYKPEVNAGISNIFSTACYRLGHSMLSENLCLVFDDGQTLGLPLRDAFFSPSIVYEDFGINPFLHGLTRSPMQEVDTEIVESVRSFLFHQTERDETAFLDLAALNIQRGRDHGLADYNQCRIDFGLDPKVCFAEITSNPSVQQKLQSTYGDVNNIDVWVGSLAEDHLPNSSVGELISVVLKDQFERLRDGDRFWYENDPDLADRLTELEATRLSDVLERNLGLAVQEDVFRVPVVVV